MVPKSKFWESLLLFIRAYAYKTLAARLEGKRSLGRPKIDRMTLLKYILKKEYQEVDWINMAWEGPEVHSCRYSNGFFGSIKRWGIS
jgi:hypothetical protein